MSVIPISDPSVVAATGIAGADLLWLDQFDNTALTNYRTKKITIANLFANVPVTASFTATQTTGANAPPIACFGASQSTIAGWLATTTYPYGSSVWFGGQYSNGSVLVAGHSADYVNGVSTTADMISHSVYFVHDDTSLTKTYFGAWSNYWVMQRNADASPNILCQMLEASYCNLGTSVQDDPYNVSPVGAWAGITHCITLDSGVGVFSSFNGFISGTTLTTVGAVTGTILAKYPVKGSGVLAGQYIVRQLTGTPNGAGTYQVMLSQSLGSLGSPVALATSANTVTTALMVSGNSPGVSDGWFTAFHVTCNAIALSTSGYYEVIKMASQPIGSAGGGHAIVWYAGTPGTAGTVSCALETDTSGVFRINCGAGAALPGLLALSGAAGGIQISPRSSTGDWVIYNPTGADWRLFRGGDMFIVSTTTAKAVPTTAATSASTGALVSAGGLGVAGTMWSGGGIAHAGPSTQAGASFTIDLVHYCYITTSASAVTVTMPAASGNTGYVVRIKQVGAGAVSSASSNVVPIGSTTAGTAITTASGKWAELQSDGTNWIVIASN